MPKKKLSPEAEAIDGGDGAAQVGRAGGLWGMGLKLSKLSPAELLKLHADIGEELRAHGLVRSSNNPAGDLAEYMFCRSLKWTRLGNSHAGVDAIDPKDGRRYQIKGRRLSQYSGSGQLSALRELPGEHFDFLAGLYFRKTIPF